MYSLLSLTMISQLYYLNIQTSKSASMRAKILFPLSKNEVLASSQRTFTLYACKEQNERRIVEVSVKNREQVGVREKFRREDSLINSSGVAQLICFGLRMPLVKRADKINETGIRKEIRGREAKAHRKRELERAGEGRGEL